jgi:hypothetical protein
MMIFIFVERQIFLNYCQKILEHLEPYALESSFMFWTYEDAAITGATYTSTDGLAAYEYWKAEDYTSVTSANAYVGSVWPVAGISAGITSWNRFLHNFSLTRRNH